MVSLYSKVFFQIKLVTKEINVPMLIIYKIIEEIPNNMNMNRQGVNFGTFLMKSSQFKEQAAKWEWLVKSVMVGWNNVIILPNTIQKEVNH